MSEGTTLGDIERLCWTLSGWQVDQRDVDRLLSAVQAYAAAGAAEVSGSAAVCPQEASAQPPVADESVQVVADAHRGAQTILIDGACVLTLTPLTRTPLVVTPPRNRPQTTYTVPAADLYEPRRTCRTCARTKDIQDFNRDHHSPGGRKSQCRDCEFFARRARKTRTAQEGEG